MKEIQALLLACGWGLASGFAASPGIVYRIDTVAGSSSFGDGGPAIAAQMGNIQGIAVDRFGNTYLSDTDHSLIRKVDTKGIITTVAGAGVAGFSGDGGPATAAQINLPYGLAADLAGDVYFADLGNNRVRRIGPDGAIVTVAGTGVKGSAGDGGLAVNAQLMTPRNVAVDAAGNLYISEFEGHRVRKVTPDGKISTIAGTGVAGFRGDGGQAVLAQLAYPAGLTLDRTGALYIADSGNQRIRKILPGGAIITALGGTPALALLTPTAAAVDASGSIYTADASGIVRCYSPSGVWSVAAGTGGQGFSGDGGPAVKAQLAAPRDLALDVSGNLYIADGARIREVVSGKIQTVAGDGYVHFVGDGGAAGKALLNQPTAVALDSAGNLYIADSGTQRIREVTAAGVIQTYTGTGAAGFNGDQVPAASAMLNSPMGVMADAYGAVYIADTYNHRIREVTQNGRIATFAGTGASGVGADGLPPAQTQLRGPRGVCESRTGIVYIVDTSNHRVLRAVSANQTQTAAGNGTAGLAGDGGPAPMAELNQPQACAVDSAGNLFIADTGNHRIVKVTPAGAISTVAGTGRAGFSGDGAAAEAAQLDSPAGIAADDNGNLYIADTGNQRIRQVMPDGTIYTIAGKGGVGFSGDGDLAANAQLNAPGGLALDGSGDLYFADTGNNRVRRLTPQAAGPAPVTTPAAVTVVNAASLAVGPVAPGEIVTIYGSGLGPAVGASGSPDATGLIGNLLAGSEVRFDGIAAPLFYAQAGQINAQAPYAIAGQSKTHVEVYYQGAVAGAADVPVASSAPALFPAVLNPDGSLNSRTNPAASGAVLTFFGTGEGVTNGANVAGQPAQPPYARPDLPVNLTVAGAPATIFYAGSAPGLAGVLQVNAQLPPGVAGQAAAQLAVGTAAAQPVTVWVGQ
jgi:uncharacterized protein (TIGR03437 family)